MNKEQIIVRMQKPARILRVFSSIFYVFSIIGTVCATLVQLVFPMLAENLITLMDSPQIEQTQDVRETIALLEGYVSLPMHAIVTMALYTLADGITSILIFLFLKKLFASLAEERYSILRSEYANGVQRVAIVMLVAAGIELVFPVAIQLMANDAQLMTEISSSSSMLLPGLALLAIATIYRYACRLQLLNEQEAYENFRASEAASARSEDAENYREEEEKESAKEKEEKTTFEGF